VRVLVSINDATGHVLPVLPTLRALIEAGHQVLLASPGPTGRRLGSLPGVEVQELPKGPMPEIEPPPPTGPADVLTWAVTRSWPNDAHGWVGELLSTARGWRPDLVIVEPVEHAGRVTAAALDLPWVEHGWGFSLPVGTSHLAAQGISGLYAEHGCRARPPDLLVDLGPYELQSPDIEPGVERFRYQPWSGTAPLLPAPVRPRILVTLGTFAFRGAAARMRLIVDALSGRDEEVVVALGNPDRRSGGDWPHDVTVADWLDLTEEVRRCALVLHHGGAGSSLSTALSGRPAVCLPQAADQFRIAARLEAAGVAVVVQPAQLSVETLTAAVDRALKDPALAESAVRLQQSNQRLPGADQLVRRLEALVP
jgi:UDP:flavonoid glycosyltransferase YjiC (YdhE family)